MTENSYRLKLEHLYKSFPGVLAVQDVSLTVHPGEILALVGENGAGKSTLMNMVNGVLSKDSGQFFLDGEEVQIDSPRKALELGITMIHQELALIPQLTVGQNIYLGREPRHKVTGLVDWKKMYADAQVELDRLGIDIPVRATISELSIAQQQLVEIAKALSYRTRLIALDEPTSSLTEIETETLFRLMHALRKEGVSLIYISHRMEEIFALADRIAVMRDGKLVDIKERSETSPAEIVRLMVGRELSDFFHKKETQQGGLILKANHLSVGKHLKEASLELHGGEIVGLSGLVGAGRTNLVRALFGIDALDTGQIEIDGKPVHLKSPRDAIRLGMGLIPEDRKIQGLCLGQSIRSNTAIGLFNLYTRFGFLDNRRINKIVKEFVNRLNVRTPGISQLVRNLSGGNQQKVVIARWLTLNPKILILDEPTRGVDVAAKAEIHALMSELAGQGVAVLMVSSELPEVLGVCDRILVMREGRIVKEFSRAEATQDLIMQAATGQM